MANPVRLAALIRFHLSELGARNAHHEFEHLTRHFARARIYSNILPATGPVSAGGDGGRDFETFQTHVVPEISIGSDFAGRSSQARRVVFACSLEKRIEAKIRADLQDLIAAGQIDEVAYFCEANLPIAKRRKLVAEANQAGFILQIFDGTAIAEWLSEPDIFWIAQEFLHLPAEVMPDRELDEGYAAHLERWKSRKPLPISRADFAAIKVGLRRATFAAAARADLSVWLAHMEAFLAKDAPRDLVRDASYELAVAHLRARGDMTPQATRIADYFSDAEDYRGIGELTNATTLLTYCFGAIWLGQFEAQDTEFFAARAKIIETVEAGLAEPIGPGRRAGLLHVRGLLEQTPAAPGVYPNRAGAVEHWNAMLDSARDAPLYPIEHFADFLIQVISRRGDDEALLSLAARTDDLLGERLGNSAAGEKAIDRAFGLLERNEPAAAIRELHKAKFKWFSGERLGGALRILLLLAEQYRMLGLAYAAKYHAMAAAFIARYESREDLGDLQPKALLELADAEDAAGNSFGFLQLFPQLFAAHFQYSDQPMDMAQHESLHANMDQLAALLGFLRRGNPSARTAVDALTADWPAFVREPIWTGANQADGFWNEGSWEEAWAGLEDALLDRPFGDIGPVRKVRWQALGIRWVCQFANNYGLTPSAEHLVCELQLIACALAGKDLGLIPADVAVEITIAPSASGVEIEDPVEAGAPFRVRLPATDRGPDDIADAVMVFAAVTPVEPPHDDPDYILDKDLADRAIRWISQQHQLAPQKPFFLYYATGSTHAPHQAPKAWLDKFRGKFDQGWDAMRSQTFERQKAMGVIPADATLTKRPDFIPAWSSLSADKQRFFSRTMEAYAAQLSYADHEIGRVIDSLRVSGQLENTLIIFVQGDNGASGEGAQQGSLYEQAFINQYSEPFKDLIDNIDKVGGPDAYNNYPTGWGWAMNTPFQYYKQTASHFGGLRDGMVVSWPARIKNVGGTRAQFHYVTDIMPTILDAVGVKAPAMLNGVAQMPLDGISMAYSFDQPESPSHRRTQVFEIMQNLGIYHDGWWANTKPTNAPWEFFKAVKTSDPNDRNWELYNIANDYSQSKDLAKSNPRKLLEMQQLFWAEAARNKILPIHSATEGMQDVPSPRGDRTSFSFQPGLTRVPPRLAPETIGHSYTITADIDIGADDGQGVLVTHGGKFGGYAFYLDRGTPVFHYNAIGTRQYQVRGAQPLSPGHHVLTARFQSDDGRPASGGMLTLTADGQVIGSGRIEHTLFARVSLYEGFDVGQDTLSPVNADYTIATSRFRGKLNRLDFTIDK